MRKPHEEGCFGCVVAIPNHIRLDTLDEGSFVVCRGPGSVVARDQDDVEDDRVTKISNQIALRDRSAIGDQTCWTVTSESLLPS